MVPCGCYGSLKPVCNVQYPIKPHVVPTKNLRHSIGLVNQRNVDIRVAYEGILSWPLDNLAGEAMKGLGTNYLF